jgi:hypothetical protein
VCKSCATEVNTPTQAVTMCITCVGPAPEADDGEGDEAAVDPKDCPCGGQPLAAQ